MKELVQIKEGKYVSGGGGSLLVQDGEGDGGGAGTFSPLVAYAFSINFILGVGVLNIPSAFFSLGLLLGAVFLCVVTFFSLLTVLWLVEVAARAEALTHYNEFPGVAEEPAFAITSRKFEVNQLCGLFIGPWGKTLFSVAIGLFIYGVLWSYAAVFANSTARLIPMPWGDCSVESSSSCHSSYIFFLFLFMCCVGPLACLDLKEQKWVQISLAIFRAVAIAIIFITTLAALFSHPYSSSALPNTSAPYTGSGLTAANFGNFASAFGALVFSQVFQTSCPILCKEVKDKTKLRYIFAGTLLTTHTIYTLMGFLVACYMGSQTPNMLNLAWNHYTEWGLNNWFGRLLSWVVVLFPAVDVLSSFPLNAVTLGNNMQMAFGSRSFQMKIMFRLLVALPPIVGAAFVSDLSAILEWTGLLGFVICFSVPAILQIQSVKASIKLWGVEKAHAPVYPGFTYFHHLGWAYFLLVSSAIALLYSVATRLI
eukprot:gnl/Hemi2/28438_TR9407_c0_g1_i1.p1 gnl/Hemi2/28438_TR9407_c0_g1~~gnl/Hemi2/28438_TR9407_c0_g1_i1.p1  ORF type:complete len:481 (+),score=99.75 gnl/Hemi2/28438_TR9407_c0_g1_i1:106-1548(+)